MVGRYYLGDAFHTFYGFTKGDRWVKGEGTSDEEALRQVARAAGVALDGDRRAAESEGA